MKVKVYVVDFEVPPRVKRWALRLGVPAVVLGLVGAAAVAHAVPVTFSDGSVLTAAQLNSDFGNIESRLQALEGASPACPAGYAQDTSQTSFVSCKRGSDEVVQVGSGASVFWIDRYEASVWADAAGATTQYGVSADDYPNTFPDNGQWTAPVYAVSETGVQPSAWLTWFQAAASCRASGKRLPNGEEWLAAARGTSDGSGCNISTSSARATGNGASCRSAAGAEDMIGNVWEWTNEWYASLGTSAPPSGTATWPNSDYNSDGTWNITSAEYIDPSGDTATGLPSAALRGGDWDNGSSAGLFALALDDAPSHWSSGVGFRCLLPR